MPSLRIGNYTQPRRFIPAALLSFFPDLDMLLHRKTTFQKRHSYANATAIELVEFDL